MINFDQVITININHEGFKSEVTEVTVGTESIIFSKPVHSLNISDVEELLLHISKQRIKDGINSFLKDLKELL